MYFGLTNAPPYFQRTIRRDFAPVLQKYPGEVHNYMDDFIVATKKDPKGVKLHKKICHKLLDIMKKKLYYLKLSKCLIE